MNYIEMNINEKEYKLTLNMRNMILLEKQLGENPLNKLIEMGNSQMPEFDFITTIMFYAMKKYQPKIKLDEVYDIVDDYLAEEENDLTSLITLVMKIFEVSGYFRQGAIENNKQPNE